MIQGDNGQQLVENQTEQRNGTWVYHCVGVRRLRITMMVLLAFLYKVPHIDCTTYVGTLGPYSSPARV